MKDGWLPREEWLKTLEARPASAAVLIENTADQLLVLKAHYKSHWSLPGGVIDAGETPLQAALREVKEETGLQLSPGMVHMMTVASRRSQDGMSYQFLFATQLTSEPNVVLQESEIADYRWLSRDQILRDRSQATD